MEAQAMRRVMEHYLRLVAAADVDAIVELMCEGVVVEDPVGGPPGTRVVGRERVREFFAAGFARSRPRPTPTGPICTTAGREAAMPFRLALTLRGRHLEIDVIDVIRFDGDGRIESLRAFWNGAEMRPGQG